MSAVQSTSRLFSRPVAIAFKLLLLVASWAIGYGLIQAGVINDYLFATMVTIGINIMLATSLNLITGFTGQFSLGHAGFQAIGAYVCALVTIYTNYGYASFILGLIAGAVASALVGFLVGLPTLRLRGDYLAIATLGMAEIIRVILLNLEITNGAAGLSGIPAFVTWTPLFVVTAGTVLILSNFLKSRYGRECIAVREDEIAAEAMGVNVTRAKVTAFTIGAFFGGLAGGTYASYFYFLKPDLFNFMASVNILVIVVLGGLGSLTGSVIGAVVLAIVSTLLQPFPAIRMILYSLILILLMLFRPSGLMGTMEITDLLPKRLRESLDGDARAGLAEARDAAVVDSEPENVDVIQ